MHSSITNYTNTAKTFFYSSGSLQYTSPISPHTHGGYEIYYFLEGDVTYFVEGNQYPAIPHDLFITNHHELHTPLIHSDKNYGRQYIQFESDFIMPLGDVDYQLLAPLDHRHLGCANKIDHTYVKAYGIDKLYLQIAEKAASPDYYTELEIKLLVHQILIAIKRIFEHHMDAFSYHPKDEKIHLIIKYIHEHISTPLALDTIASHFFMNKYYLSHFFKKNTGFSIKEYILNKRILLAKTLILKGIPITSVCYDVGFNNYSCFYKAFMKLEKQSPKTFLKENQPRLKALKSI